MKKFIVSFVVVVALFGMAFAPQSKAATWEKIGADYVSFKNFGWGKNFHQGFVKHSSGGKILIKVPYTPITSQYLHEPVMEIQVWEDDGNDIFDRRITNIYHYASKRPSPPKYYTVDVSNYVDGLNGKAEIYLKYGGNYKTRVKTVIYD